LVSKGPCPSGALLVLRFFTKKPNFKAIKYLKQQLTKYRFSAIFAHKKIPAVHRDLL
jgi:hypothetical protein